jgi:hypothetical protein
MKPKNSSRFNCGVRNLCAVVAISIALPALAYADRDNDKDDHGRGDNDKQERGDRDHGDSRVSAVPEANTAWVLLPFVGAVLFFSARHLFPRKATE